MTRGDAGRPDAGADDAGRAQSETVQRARSVCPGWMTRAEALQPQGSPPRLRPVTVSPPVAEVTWSKGFGLRYAESNRDPVKECEVMYPRPVLWFNYDTFPWAEWERVYGHDLNEDHPMIRIIGEAIKPVCPHAQHLSDKYHAEGNPVELHLPLKAERLSDGAAAPQTVRVHGVVLFAPATQGNEHPTEDREDHGQSYQTQLTEEEGELLGRARAGGSATVARQWPWCVPGRRAAGDDCTVLLTSSIALGPRHRVAQGALSTLPDGTYDCRGLLVTVPKHEVRPRSRRLCDLQCRECGMKHNLWMCIECGNVGCGRTHNFGIRGGGNGHALRHFYESGHPVSAKLGAISMDACDVHCYACSDEVQDPQLYHHLLALGLDMRLQNITAFSLADMQQLHSPPIQPHLHYWIYAAAMRRDRKRWAEHAQRAGPLPPPRVLPPPPLQHPGALAKGLGTLAPLPHEVLVAITLMAGSLPAATLLLSHINHAFRYIAKQAAAATRHHDLSRSLAPSSFAAHVHCPHLQTLRWHNAWPSPSLVELLPTLYPALQTLSVSNWMVSPYAASDCPEDAPGVYEVISSESPIGSADPDLQGVAVSDLPETGGRRIAEIPTGRCLKVDRVILAEREHKVRGHVVDPPGWITLLDLKDSHRWAAPVAVARRERERQQMLRRAPQHREHGNRYRPGMQVELRLPRGHPLEEHYHNASGIIREVLPDQVTIQLPEDHPAPDGVIQLPTGRHLFAVRSPGADTQWYEHVPRNASPVMALFTALPQWAQLRSLSLQTHCDGYWFDVWAAERRSARARGQSEPLLPSLRCLDVFNLFVRTSTLRELFLTCPGVEALRMGSTQENHQQDPLRGGGGVVRRPLPLRDVEVVREAQRVFVRLAFLDWLAHPQYAELPVSRQTDGLTAVQGMRNLHTLLWTNSSLGHQLLSKLDSWPALKRVDTGGLVDPRASEDAGGGDELRRVVSSIVQAMEERPALLVGCDSEVSLRLSQCAPHLSDRLLLPSEVRELFAREHIPDPALARQGLDAGDIIRLVQRDSEEAALSPE